MIRFGDSREPAQPPRWFHDDGQERRGRHALRVIVLLLILYGLPTAIMLGPLSTASVLLIDLLIPVPIGVIAIWRRLDLGTMLFIAVPLLFPWFMLVGAFLP
jgi:hypothetical protein